MKLRILGLALALALCLCGMAAADTAIVSVKDVTARDIILNESANTMAVMQEDSSVYEIMDVNGNVLSEGQYEMAMEMDGMYRVANGSGVNNYGLLDGSGKVMMPVGYGDVVVLSDRWQIGVKLVEATADNYDYKSYSSNKFYLVGQYDVYYKGTLAGSLDRLQYYQAEAQGDYLYVKPREGSACYYDKTLTPSGYDKTDGVYYEEFEYDRKTKAVWHKGSNQKAFCEGCTLTADEVSQTVWVQDDVGYDLYGNVLFDLSKKNYDTIYTFRGDYAQVRLNKLYGLIDRNGNEILPCEYSTIEYDDNGFFANGYVIAEKDGKLVIADSTGKEVVTTNYGFSNCKTYYAPFVTLQDMEGKTIVISPAAGELTDRYNEVSLNNSGLCPVFVAELEEDVVGLVDLNGKAVIPFDGEYDNTYKLSVSNDGTLVVGEVDYHEYKVYILSHEAAAPAAEAETPSVFDSLLQFVEGNEPAPTAAPAAAGKLACTGCGFEPAEGTSPKFCSECGTPFPQKLVCSGCGFEPAEGTSPKFCSECGTAF